MKINSTQSKVTNKSADEVGKLVISLFEDDLLNESNLKALKLDNKMDHIIESTINNANKVKTLINDIDHAVIRSTQARKEIVSKICEGV